MKIRILKRILIIPALVAILLVNISYASYRSPWVVKVEAATGNAYMDAFITALQFLGYSVTGSSAAQSAQKDLERYINRILADNKAIDKKRLDNEAIQRGLTMKRFKEGTIKRLKMANKKMTQI